MAKLLKLRRGTTSQHGSFTGAEGEVTVDTDKETLVVHDGSTAGGHAVAAEDMANVSSASIVGRLGTGSIVKAKLEADIIDSTKLADDAVNSEHYVDGSIDTVHIADAQVTHVKLANDCVDGDNIQDDVVNSEHIAAGAVDLEHMSSESVDEDNLKISNSGTNGHFLQKQSGNAGGLTWAAVDLSTYAPLASPALTGTATGVNLTLSGNLTVNGTTTTVATTNTKITDNLIELNSGASSNANDSGILIERGSTGDNAIIAWDESADKFTVGTTTGTADSTGNISITTGTLVANVEGNVTGNTSGSSGSCTGNAATATQLATARNIGGVSFNGTAAINLPGVNTAGNQNTTGTSGGFTAGSASNLNSGTVPTARLGSGTASSSNFLRGDGSWQTVDTSPAGSNTQVQFNNSGAFAGSSNLTFNSSSGTLTSTVIQADYIQGEGSDGTINRFKWDKAANKLTLDDNCKIGLGNAGPNDCALYHDGSNTYITNSTGELRISAITGTSTISDSLGNLRSVPRNTKTSSYTLLATDAGKCVTTNSAVTVNPSVFSEADVVSIINTTGSNITITQGSNFTIYYTADGTTGNRTLNKRGMATLYFTDHNIAYIAGGGLS